MEATTPPADVPGYRLTQFLGAGAFGQVWVGRDLKVLARDDHEVADAHVDANACPHSPFAILLPVLCPS